jgi:hypothetical protein
MFMVHISREESIHEQRKAQVLLLLTWNHPAEKGVYTGKLFDYLAAQRPVLAMGIPGSVIEELLDETQAGTICIKYRGIKKRNIKLLSRI